MIGRSILSSLKIRPYKFNNLKNLFYNKYSSQRSFCTINKFADLNYPEANLRIVHKIKSSSETTALAFNFQETNESFELEVGGSMQLKELKQFLEERFHTQAVTFLTLDKVELAVTTQWHHLGDIDFYILIGEDLLLRVNNEYIKNWEGKTDVMARILSMGAPYYYSRVLSDFFAKFESLNEQTIGRTFLDGVKRPNEKIDKDALITNLQNSLPSSKAKYQEELNVLVNRHKDATKQHAYQLQQKSFLEDIARRKAKRVMCLGFAALVGQFFFVGYGTYYIWSWDIVEPLAYFSTLGASIILSWQYFKIDGEYTNDGYLDFLTQKYLKRLCSHHNFDLEHFKAVQKELDHLKTDIKNNILSDL